MSDNSPPPLPPVRLRPVAHLARDALTTPLITRAARLARWAKSGVRVTADGALGADQLPTAVAALALDDDPEGAAATQRAWHVAVGTGLVRVRRDVDGSEHTAAGGEPARLVKGSPGDVLDLWLQALDLVIGARVPPGGAAESVPSAGLVGGHHGAGRSRGAGGAGGRAGSGWSADGGRAGEAAFLDGVLAQLYVRSAGAEEAGGEPVPLPALAASMIVPDGMAEPTDDVLEQVSEAMLRLDGRFRALHTVGLVEFRPVDETLLVGSGARGRTTGGRRAGAANRARRTAASDGVVRERPPSVAHGAPGDFADADAPDVARYGMVRLTPLGRFGLRCRLMAAGFTAPVVGDLAEKGAEALLHGTADFPHAAARDEFAQWVAGRAPLDAARDLLAAARGADDGAPLRRLRCQQALCLVGREAEPALRDVLDDAELGGLARVWLTEQGVADVPPPTRAMVFWLTVDTLAAQLAAEGNSTELLDLVEDLARRHSGFFDTAWQVDHPATARVLEAMGRLHPDRRIAAQARAAARRARSRHID